MKYSDQSKSLIKTKEIIIKAPEIKQDDNPIPKFLFQPPFRIVVVAPSNSGKSVMISNLISSRELPYRSYFKKNIFIWSSTFSLDDPSFAMSDNIDKANVYDEYNESTITDLLNEQTSIIKQYGKKKAPHLLFIFDDVVQEIPRNGSILSRLFFSARHYNISLILLSQQYKMVPRAIRLNASDIVIFQTGNNAEITKIAEEQAIPIEKFKQILKDATDEPFSFLVIHNKLPIKDRYQLRLSDKIYPIN